jgi:hypothetical protein
VLARLAGGPSLLPGAIVVAQHPTKTPPVAALDVWKDRRFGETTLTFFRAPA